MIKNNSRVLVVNPPVTDFKLYDEWMHPVGLYYLIDLLHSNGAEVFYYNCLKRETGNTAKKYHTGMFFSEEIKKPAVYASVENRRYKRYGVSSRYIQMYIEKHAGEVPDFDALFIGSMMTYWAPEVVATVRELGNFLPGVPVTCGGIATRLMTDYFTRELPDVSLFHGTLDGDRRSVSLRGLSQPLSVPEHFSLLPALRMLEKPLMHGPLMLTTGCPMRCSYCASGILQPRFAPRPLSLVLKEVEYLVEEAGVEDLAFFDDALLFTASEVLLPFLDALMERGYNVRLHCPNGMHLKYLNESVLSTMRRSGFTTLRFGYESGKGKHRTQTAGKVDRELTKNRLALVRESGFEDVGVYIMGGLPESGPQEMMAEMQFIASCGVKVKPVFLAPVPGTELFNHYVQWYPQLQTDPYWHNDTFFITQLPGWNWGAVEEIRRYARKLNGSLGSS